MSEKKRQHYVPQFYLRNFSETEKSIGMFRFGNQKYAPNASIVSVAYRDYLYGKDGDAENILSKMESLWARAISRWLYFDKIKLDEKTEDHLYYLLLEFIIVSLTRTAKLVDEYREFYKYFENIFDEVKQRGQKLAFDETSFYRNLETPNIIPMKSTIKTTPYLFDLEPLLIINLSNRGFITSDNPAIKYNQFYASRCCNRNYGVASAGLQIFLPLSPKMCFCLFDKDVYTINNEHNIILIKSGSMINEINRLAVENSYEQIFFSNSEKESYIKSISRYKSSSKPKVIQELPVYGSQHTMLWLSTNSIKVKLNLPFFQVKPLYTTVPLPTHMGGLTRTATEKLNDELEDKFKKSSLKIVEEE